MIYYSLFLGICFLGYFFLGIHRDRKLFLFLSFFMMALVLGLRGNKVGEDTAHYLTLFNIFKNYDLKRILSNGLNVKFGQWDESVEIGYVFLNKIVQIFTSDGQVLIFVVALLSCMLMARFIYKCIPKHVFLATIIFMCDSLYMSMFNALRQMLAVAIVLNSFEYMRKKEYKKVLLIFVFALLIHKSAIVFSPIIFYFFVRDKRRAIVVTGAVSLILCLATPMVMLVGAKLFPSYAVYFSENYWSNHVGGTLVLWLMLIAIIMYILKHGVRNDEEYFGTIGSILYIAIEVIGLRIAAFSRITYYFRAFCMMLYPAFSERFTKKSRRIYDILIMALMLMEFVSYTNVGSRKYMFFWQ